MVGPGILYVYICYTSYIRPSCQTFVHTPNSMTLPQPEKMSSNLLTILIYIVILHYFKNIFQQFIFLCTITITNTSEGNLLIYFKKLSEQTHANKSVTLTLKLENQKNKTTLTFDTHSKQYQSPSGMLSNLG